MLSLRFVKVKVCPCDLDSSSGGKSPNYASKLLL